MKTRDYIDQVRAKTKTGSDYAVAQTTGLAPDTVRKFRLGKRVMDNRSAARIALALDRPVAELIAAAEIERTTARDPMRTYWRGIYNLARRMPAAMIPPR